MTLFQILFLAVAALLLVPLAMVLKTIEERLAARRSSGPAPRSRVVRERSLPQGLPLHARRREASLADLGQAVDPALAGDVAALLAEIPPTPIAVKRMLDEMADPRSTARSVARIAQSEPVLAGMLLRAINSAAFGRAEPVVDLDQAIALLGYRTVQALVLHYGLSGSFQPAGSRSGYRSEDLWIHSLSVSLAAQTLAAGRTDVDAGFVTTLGLLHDIGKLFLTTRFPDRIAELRQAGVETYLERERALFGADHTTIGSQLAERWGLPADVCRAIRYHHAPEHPALDHLPAERGRGIGIVFVANQLAKLCHVYCEDVEVDLVPDEFLERLGLAAPLEGLLTGAVKKSITWALHFVDAITPTPLPAIQRLVGVRTARELAGLTRIPAAWLEDPILARITVGSAPSIDRLGALETVPIELVGCALRDLPRSTWAGRIDVTLSFEDTAAGAARVVEALDVLMPEAGFAGDRRFPLRFAAKYFLANILHAGIEGGRSRLRLRRGLEHEFLLFESPGLEFRRLFPVDECRRDRGDGLADRVCQALVAVGVGPLLTLGWFDRVEATRTGGAIVLSRSTDLSG